MDKDGAKEPKGMRLEWDQPKGFSEGLSLCKGGGFLKLSVSLCPRGALKCLETSWFVESWDLIEIDAISVRGFQLCSMNLFPMTSQPQPFNAQPQTVPLVVRAPHSRLHCCEMQCLYKILDLLLGSNVV